MHNKFAIKKWVNRLHFFIDEKNLELCLIIKLTLDNSNFQEVLEKVRPIESSSFQKV